MSYTGDVAPGGPADVRELPELSIAKLSVGPMDNNAYLLRCRRTGEGLLIDAADEPDRLLGLVGPGGIAAVATTHQHGDHWRALAEVVERTGARTIAHPLDAGPLPVPVTDPVEHGDRVPVGAAELEVVHLRGHTPGSIALVYRDPAGAAHLFTGDSLFPGGVGNTRGDAERFASLLDDVTERIFGAFGDDAWVYPGHGRDTTLRAERPHLGEWRERGW
ncbi:MBL fold metallo-hydrolase [Allonocardiopsis opalescens]|uniref:Glyoxylase-like metal-dependent hydrolase (Beta-lactamase superfamily II) n=1 Tax=Allonocardiopsis opalescens TaxID=1144618 RepID=A0A2T0Q0L5_9ACTN|nr:MBL fold metallo-hydrolase [Allonocardiopsis opalescens]PRX97324.1 glyoxylase-like metal-dependent hydrolase (beta-lactamase superfamily II) [Allonocardiopsis opalescens]